MAGARRPFFCWPPRWPVPGLRRAVLGACGSVLLVPLSLAGFAQAQTPPRPARPQAEKCYMNKMSAILPIMIDPRLRSSLSEVQLYVKDDPSKPWLLKESASPDQKEFNFRAPHDGEFWFTVVTKDKNGKFSPSDLRNEPAGVVVVVDTQAPEPELRCLPDSAEGHLVQCALHDANPDPSKTRFEYQTGDQKWRPLDALSGQPDVFCIPVQAVTTGKVRVTAVDRCGNGVTREIDLASCGGVATTAAAEKAPATPRQGQQDGPALSMQPPAPPTPPVQEVQSSVAYRPAPAPMPSQVQAQSLPLGAVDTQAAAPPAQTSPVTQTGCWSGGMCPTPPPTAAVPGVRKVVNNPRVYLDYKIDQAGTSGIGKIEIYVTRNQGQTWDRLGEDEDRQSPAIAELPGEGVYGIKLVVSNGRGFGGTPPSAGESPDWWIEVDTTKPYAELSSVQMGQGNDQGAVLINYTARDKNLAAEPIDLFYSPKPEGPWQPIARGVKNDSVFRWSVPRDMGIAEAYVRLKVTDLAGNPTVCETNQPVLLDDGTRPRIRVTGVTTNAPISASVSGSSFPSLP